MSAELRRSAETDAGPQGTTVGGSKPLHRFMKGQPKTVGVVVVTLGASLFIVSVAINVNTMFHDSFTAIPQGFLLGTLFILCGIMFILAEHNPTKKTVTVSLALSIVTTLIACWTVFYMTIHIGHYTYTRQFDDNSTENRDAYWYKNAEVVLIGVDIIFTFYTLVGVVIFIVMSSLAGAALRSTKSQAVVVMTTAPTDAPVE